MFRTLAPPRPDWVRFSEWNLKLYGETVRRRSPRHSGKRFTAYKGWAGPLNRGPVSTHLCSLKRLNPNGCKQATGLRRLFAFSGDFKRYSDFRQLSPVDLTGLENRHPCSEEQQQRSRRCTREIAPSRQSKGRVANTVAEFQNRPEPN